jgi:adenylosuccinate synthase
MSVLAVVGAQYGSEGKGNIVGKLADDYDVHVRTGSCNAGHSIQHQGRTWKMQVVPCGWINESSRLVIGRGSLLSPEILLRELREIAKVDDTIWDRIKVDYRTGLLDARHANEEGGTHGSIHNRIGSTGEGVGAARVDRVNRDPDNFRMAQDMKESWMQGLLSDTVEDLNTYVRKDYPILLEGSQGFGLSLVHGDWPFVTSHDTNAATLFADCGIPITSKGIEIMLVARTYPIRVAGNSGPLKGETDWDKMSRKLGSTVEERTTVTKKIRRVGEWDDDLFYRACMVNGPTGIAINFLDYLHPQDAGVTAMEKLSSESWEFIYAVEDMAMVPVTYVGTGGPEWNLIKTGRE